MDKYQAIAQDAEWVIKKYGSDAGECQNSGSKAKNQAERIARYVRQYDMVSAALENGELKEIDLVSIHLGPSIEVEFQSQA